MECKRYICKKEVRSCKIKFSHWRLIDTGTSSNVKIIFEANVHPVIQLVYMKKPTETRKRKKDKNAIEQMMQLEMMLYLVKWLQKLSIDLFPE